MDISQKKGRRHKMATNSNIIEIILRAQDQASQAAKNVEKSIDNIGKTSTRTESISNQAFNRMQSSIQKIGSTTRTVTTTLNTGFNNFKTVATGAFNAVTTKIQSTITQSKFYQTHLQQYSPIFSQIQNTASSTFGAVASKLGSIRQSGESTFSALRTTVGTWGTDMKNKISSSVDAIGTKFDSMKTKVHGVGSIIKSTFSSAAENAKSKIQSISDAFSGLNGQMAGLLGTIGVGSFTQMTVGLSMAREQMTALMTATMGSREAADSFVESLRGITENSLVRLNDLGLAMSKIKMSTGMTNEQLQLIAPTVNDIGQRAILMGRSSEEAADLMVAAYRGLNGEFDMLKSNFGITRDLLIDMGWSGAASDVEGYNAALEKALERGGNMSGMMDTTTGKIQQVKSAFNTAGRKIGETIQPLIDKVLEFLVTVKDNCPQAFEAILLVFGALSGLVAIAPTLAPMITLVSALAGVLKGAGLAGKILSATTTLLNIATSISTSSMELNTVAIEANILSAKVAEGAHLGLSGALNLAATAAWNLAKAILLNPWTYVIIAVVALVAIMWHLYNTNEEVRNTFNAIGEFLRGSLTQAWNTLISVLQRVWDMLVKVGMYLFTKFHNAWMKIKLMLEPLKAVFEKLKDAFGKLVKALTGGSDAANGAGDEFDTLGAILDAVEGYLKTAIDNFTFMVEIFSAILIPTIGLVVNIFSALITAIAGIVDAVQRLMSGELTLGEFFGKIWEVLTTYFSSISTAVMGWLQGIFVNLFLILGSMLTGVYEWATGMVTGFITAAWQSVTGFLGWIASLPMAFWNWLMDALNKAYQFGVSVVNTLATAANQALTEFIDWICQLPGRVWTWLVNTVNKAKTFATNIATAMRNAATTAVTNFANKIKELPQRMWEELVHIKDKIYAGVGMIVAAMKNLAWSMIDNFKAVLHINSPGIFHDLIGAEIGYVASILKAGAGTVGAAAGILAEGIVNGFGEPFGNGIIIPSFDADIQMTTKTFDIDATNRQYSYIVDTTTKVVDKLVDAWTYMKDEILENAKEIREFPINNDTAIGGINQIYSQNTLQNNNTTQKTTYDGEIKVHVIHDFINIPSSLTTQQVKTIMTETSKDKEWIHQLVQNTEFQKQDMKMKVRNNNRIIRNGG